MNKNLRKIACALVAIIALAGCGKDHFGPEDGQIQPGQITDVEGFYLLNEGNWGANKATLDYYSYGTGIYKKNIYDEVNPEVVKGLGDVGYDIKIHGSRLYIVLNGSNKVEVLDVKSAKKIGQVNIPNGRSIQFNGNKAYVTSFENYVAVIDTATLQIVKKINVGQQPEEMAIVKNKLYVANSGGYNAPKYDRTVSVIDLSTETEIKKIDVGINLNRLKADKYGDLYVTSRGDYGAIPSNLYVIDTETDAVKKVFDVAVDNFTIHNDIAYAYGITYNSSWVATPSYLKINVKDEAVLEGGFITDGTEKDIVLPYGVSVNPITGDIYVTDAKDLVTPGKLYAYDKNGKRKFEVVTGDIPAHMVFYTKTAAK